MFSFLHRTAGHKGVSRNLKGGARLCFGAVKATGDGGASLRVLVFHTRPRQPLLADITGQASSFGMSMPWAVCIFCASAVSGCVPPNDTSNFLPSGSEPHCIDARSTRAKTYWCLSSGQLKLVWAMCRTRESD